MPIEIRELVIKATVTQGSGSGGGGTPPAGGNNNAVTPAEDMINTCAEKMLEILKEKMER